MIVLMQTIASDARNARSRLRLNSRVLPSLVVAAFVLQLVAPYRGWMMLFVALGGAWLLSYLWARALARRLRLEREVRYGWAQVGDRLEERFTVVNDSLLPALWFEVQDHSTLPGYAINRASGVGGLSVNQWITQCVCARRGLYALGPTTLYSGDPLGIYTVTVHEAASAALVVMPPVVPLPAIEVAPGGRAGEGRRMRDTAEPTVSAARVREYHPGDSMRWIHWRTTARRDSIFVRMFDGAPAGDWWVFLDLDRRVQAGEGQDSTLEHGVILAASLADRGLRAGHAVGLAADGGETIWLSPQGGEEQRWRIMRALTFVHEGQRPLGELLVGARASFRQATSLIVITSDGSGAWIPPLLPLLRLGIAPTVLLLDQNSFGGAGDARQAAATLNELGIAHYLIGRDLLDRPELRAGRQGQWEWRVSGTGRAIAVRAPRDANWRSLGR